MSSRRALSLLALGALAGCTRNARLELAVELPASERLAAAELLVLSDPPDFEGAAWATARREPLDEVGDTALVHILAEGESIERPLGLRVRLCPTDACAGDSPEVAVRVERAFYRGALTWLTIAIPDVPDGRAAPIDVGRCAVGGCLDGDAVEDFCRLDDTHYCEP